MTDSWQRADRALLADLALARGGVDRAADRRTQPEFLKEAWSDPASRVVVVSEGTSALAPAAPGARPALALAAPGDVPADAEIAFLGCDGPTSFFLARTDWSPAGSTRSGLREVGALLGDRDVGLLATAVALDNWHAAHPRCSRCGAPTVIATAGWVRQCPEDGSEHYPRTDPAVIMLAVDVDDRALLGRQGRWAPGWFSTLAGFVEPGESAEAAVRRELLEEAGVVVGEVRYLGSQPWPFPSSLMLGYHARAESTQISVDGEEIVEARWFSRDELRAACAAGEVALPPAVSIARRLIERWYGEPLPGDWARP